MKSGAIICWLMLACGAATFAQVPSIINYQGRIAVGGTAVFDGSGQFKFALVNGGTNLNRAATAMAIVSGGFIVGITVSDGGTGYLEAPLVTINDSTGSNALARASVAAGAVTEIVVTNPGKKYSAAPVIVVGPPPPNFAYETFWSNDGTSSAGAEPTGAVPIRVSQGAFSADLGDTSISNMAALPASVLTNADVRLRIWFSDGTGFQQFHPDQRLTAAPYALLAARVADGTVGSAQLAPGSVGSIALARSSVDAAALGPAAVGTPSIADGAVSAAKLAPDPDGVAKLSGGTISVTSGAVAVSGALAVTGRITAGALQGNGAVPWEVVSATSVQARGNSGYLADNASEVRVNLPIEPSEGDIVRVAGKGQGGWALTANPGQTITISAYLQSGWSPRSPGGAITVAAASSNGMNLVAAGAVGRIFTSRDAGLHWTSRGPDGEWRFLACSADGRKIIAATKDSNGNGTLWTSDSFGDTWVQRGGNSRFDGVACSADGIQMVALRNGVANGGAVLTSSDSGATWTPGVVSTSRIYSETDKLGWGPCAMSADGRKVVSAIGRHVVISTDAGNSWQLRADLETELLGGPLYAYVPYTTVACSPDGATMLAGTARSGASVNQGPFGGFLIVSTNAGGSWLRMGPLDGLSLSSTALGGNGQAWLATTASGPLYVGSYQVPGLGGTYRSLDRGDTWQRTAVNPQGIILAAWSDGDRLLTLDGGQLMSFRSSPEYVQVEIRSILGDENAAIELQYIGGGKFRTLSREGNISY